MNMRMKTAGCFSLSTLTLLASVTSFAANKVGKGLASNSMVLGMIHMSKTGDLRKDKLTIGHSAGQNHEVYQILLKRPPSDKNKDKGAPHGCAIVEKGDSSGFTVVYQDEKAQKLIEVSFTGQPETNAYEPVEGTDPDEASLAKQVLVPIVEALPHAFSK